MIRCTKCDTVNPDDAVCCSNCASFLEWTGEKIDAATAAALTAAAAAKKADEQVKAEPPIRSADEPEPEPTGAEPTAPDEQPAKPHRSRPRKSRTAAVQAKAATDAGPQVASTAEAEAAAEAGAPAGPTAKLAAERKVEEEREPEPALPPPPPPPPPPPINRPIAPVVFRLDETPPELRTDAEPPPTEPPAQKPKPTFRFRAAAATTAVPAPGPTTTEPAAAQPGSNQAPPAQSSATQAQATEPPARRPVAEDEEPASRKPTAEVLQRPKQRPSQIQPLASEPAIKPGDLICSNCGAGNDPARRFCRRCGTSLAMAVVARKPPWYTRLLRRNRRAYAAGDRPGAMGTAGQPGRSIIKPALLILVVGLLVVLVGAYFIDRGVRRTVDGLIGSVGTLVDTTTHQANLAFDGNASTYWLVDPSGGIPTEQVPLKDTVNVTKVLVHSGAGTGPEFQQYRRPKTIEFTFPSKSPIKIVLADDPAAQEFALPMPAVAVYQFRILDFYPAANPDQKLIALREVQVIASAN